MDVIIDEVTQVKQGKKSVGVTRQYLGCVGKTANGQVTVSLHGLVGEYDLPLTGQLYLPEAGLSEAEQRRWVRHQAGDRAAVAAAGCGVGRADRAGLRRPWVWRRQNDVCAGKGRVAVLPGRPQHPERAPA